MRFHVISGTRSGRLSKVMKPSLEMAEGGDVLEAAVGERRAVVALRRSEPADLAMQPVVVVVADITLEGDLGIAKRAEHLAIEHLTLERRPERLDLAVGPGGVDLGADVAHRKLAQGLAEAREHTRHPADERRPVVAHEVKRLAAQLDAVAQPLEDRRSGLGRGDAQPEHVAGVVIDQADDPGLEVALSRELDEEGSFDVDVPERVGASSLVARTARTWQRRARRAEVVEELLDPEVADPGDLASLEFRGDALGVPVRMQADRDHHLLDPGRMTKRRSVRPATLRHERGKTAGGLRRLPAEKAAPAATAGRERGGHTLLTQQSHQTRALADHRQLRTVLAVSRRPASASRQEPEARTFLVRVPEPAPVRIAKQRGVAREDLIHTSQRERSELAVPEITWNLN